VPLFARAIRKRIIAGTASPIAFLAMSNYSLFDYRFVHDLLQQQAGYPRNFLMLKPLLTPLSLLIVVASMLESHAAVQTFVMKQATYGPEYGAFCVEAKLDAKDDTATLTIQVAKKEKDFVLDRLHTSHPALITSTDAADVTTISIKFSAVNAQTVGVTYMLSIKDTHSFRHGIERSTGELSTYVQITDVSKSNAVWKSTVLAIRRGPIELAEKISMGAGESILLPVSSLTQYSVQLNDVKHYRLSAGQVYELLSIYNPGQQRLPAGPVRILDKGTLTFVTALSKNLEPGKATELLIRPASTSVIVSKAGESAVQWYEAASLNAGILKYRTRSVMPIKLENKSNGVVIIKRETHEDISIAGAESRLILHPTGPVIDPPRDANLFDLTPETVSDHLVQLRDYVQVVAEDVSAEKVGRIVAQYEDLQNAFVERKKLNDSKTVLEARLRDFYDNRNYPDIIKKLVELLADTETALMGQQTKVNEATNEIATLLFDAKSPLITPADAPSQ